MKLLHSDTAFIDRMFPNMPHHVVCISNEVVANFPKGARTRVVLRINGQGSEVITSMSRLYSESSPQRACTRV